jgi:hypothetical protein
METFAYAMRKLDELNKELAPIAAATAQKPTERVPAETADAPSVDPDIYDQSGEASRPNQRGVRQVTTNLHVPSVMDLGLL